MDGRAKQCSGRAQRSLVAALDELEAIAPGIFGVKAATLGECLIFNDPVVVPHEGCPQPVQISDGEGRMRFARRPELLVHADVQLLAAALKPATTPRSKRRGLFELGHAKNPAVEVA